MTLNENELALLKDTADTNETAYVVSPIDIYGPINYEVLKAEILRLGTLRLRSMVNPYTVEIAFETCTCDQPECEHDIIVVRRRNGLFSIKWMLSPEQLLMFDSIEHLKQNVLAGYFIETCLERQAIEQDIERMLGKHYMDVENPLVCFCENCAKKIGDEEVPLHMLLSQMAHNLNGRLSHIAECKEVFGESVEAFVTNSFDLGYQLGRVYSEYQVKRDIERLALAGKTSIEQQARRTQKAGERSAEKRAERMQALLGCMEELIAGSPALVRAGPDTLAKMGCEDAAAADPALWSQGAGQLEEYLGQIRRGEAGPDLQSRYFAIFPPKISPTKRTA